MEIWFQVSESDEWISVVAIVLSFIWTFVGCLGYYASLKNNKKILMIYLGIMIFNTILLCVLGVWLIIFAYNLENEVNAKWNDINSYLKSLGYEIPIILFTENLDEVVKFAGLYSLAFFIFNIIGITASSFQLKKIYNLVENN